MLCCPLWKGTAADLCHYLSHCGFSSDFTVCLKWALPSSENWRYLWINLSCLFGPAWNLLLCFREAPFLQYSFQIGLLWTGEKAGLVAGFGTRLQKEEKGEVLSQHVLSRLTRSSQVTGYSSPPFPIQCRELTCISLCLTDFTAPSGTSISCIKRSSFTQRCWEWSAPEQL